MSADFKNIENLTFMDIAQLRKAEQTYGDSWRSRGGVGAFMMLARKWDRIENQCKKENYNIFETIKLNPSKTGILDDIKDLRCYLLLVESFATQLLAKANKQQKTNSVNKENA
jgi:hypothetical protein|tara:strand:+ start:2815 stop:3153 length:339 start_codon:yes stop_codon:yes gene_type:complete